MKRKSEDQSSINMHLHSLLVPQEILNSFTITSIEEKEEDLFIYLVEKEDCIPEKNIDLVLNGYLNPVELNSFPIAGKRCYLRLTRRKWKLRRSDGSKSYTNTYDFALEGTKATKLFGSFLKEFGL
jgi:hypothetical protein